MLPADGAFLAVPVTIIDSSGLVVSVLDWPPDGQTDRITPAPGHANAVVYRWLGGRCDRATSIRVDRSDGSVTLLRTTEVSGETCLLDGIERSVVIDFRGPIDPASIIDLTDVLF